MRVCYVTNRAFGTDGWGRYTVELLKAIRAFGIEPVLVSASPEIDPALINIEHYPILNPVLSGSLSTPRSLLKTPQLRRILKSCEAVHCLVELYAPLVALSRPAKIPYFLTAHGTWAIRPLENPKTRLLFVPAFRRADVIICQSRFTQGWMAKLMDLPRSIVLTGGVIPEQFQREVNVKLPAWVNGAKIVLTAGAIKPRKGQQIALEAVAIVHQQFPDLHYVLAGNDKSDYAAQLKRRVAELNLGDKVHFLGMVSQDELVAWFQRAEVFLLTPINDGSSFEGLGLVYLEAGAAGTPSIGSLNCGAEDAILEGESGLLVPQHDSQSTAAALIKILSDDQLRAQMGMAAQQQANRLTWTHLASELATLYSAMIKE